MKTKINGKDFYNKTAFPVAVRREKSAQGAETLFNGDGELVLKAGSFVIYDMGAESVGGYPIFNVKSYTGNPVLRIAYSDRMLPFLREKTMAKGDFVRNSCKYLGVELPVMPANPDRFEEYRIARTGKYNYPLIQGQERFVLIYLAADKNGEKESVTISSFYVIDTSIDLSPTGYFISDAEEVDRLWLASARTVRLATIYSKQWEKVEDFIALRKLTFSDEGAVIKGVDCRTLTLTAMAEIYLNPAFASGVGFLIFSDGKTGYKIALTDDGKLTITKGTDILSETQVNFTVANSVVKIKIEADAKKISVSANGKKLAEYKGNIETGNSFGFYMQSEWRAALTSVEAVCDGKVVEGAFDTDNYGIISTDYFIADGAKRDRLPWTGDLYWAIDGAWHAFGKNLDPAATFDLLAFHQNPEGFIFGTCYPENKVKPMSKDYGYYQSDAFAVWFVVSVLTYYEFSGDDSVKKYFSEMRRCMDYVWEYVDKADNLFIQRYETSKGLWDHDLGDSGKTTYTNMLIADAFLRFAKFAEKIGEKQFAATCRVRGRKIKRSVIKHLYDRKKEGFVKKKGSAELCDLSNPYAMAQGLVGKGIAGHISKNVWNKTRAYGKIMILMIRGLYDHGYPAVAEKLLFGKTPYYKGKGKLYSIVDWVGAIGNDDLPETVYECMHNPPYDFGENQNWGDLSHPDSAINGVISAYIAGIRNIGVGFDRILIKPNPYKCRKIRCGVPTKYGLAEIDIALTEKGSIVAINVPEKTTVKTDFSALPKPVKCWINRKKHEV